MMSEKRFVYIEHKGTDHILDYPNWDLDFIEMLGDTLEPKEVVDLLNNLHEENEQLRKKLECYEYSHFLNELDEIHKKVDKSDLSDFNPLKEDEPLNDYNPLKEKLYYWQCKYYKRDYKRKRDMCTRCNCYGGLLNYCLKDKCDKMVEKDYEVTVTHFGDGVSIGLKEKRWTSDE